jgi:hypothetical protein
MKIESSSHKVTQAEACAYQKNFKRLSFKYYGQRVIDIFIEILNPDEPEPKIGFGDMHKF